MPHTADLSPRELAALLIIKKISLGEIHFLNVLDADLLVERGLAERRAGSDHRVDAWLRQTMADDLEEAELPCRGIDRSPHRGAIIRRSPPPFEIDDRNLRHLWGHPTTSLESCARRDGPAP